MRIRSLSVVAALALVLAGALPEAWAITDVRVSGDNVANSYLRYDGTPDAPPDVAPAGDLRTSPPWPSTRPRPTWWWPGRTTIAARPWEATSGPAITDSRYRGSDR
jgi:hypothetical protein